MSVSGVVREWHPDDGWGVIDADVTPGGCWAHFSRLRMRGYEEPTAGQAVELTVEPARQDGYEFRALAVGPQDHLGPGGLAAVSAAPAPPA